MGGLAGEGRWATGGKDIGRGEDVTVGEDMAGGEDVAREGWSRAGKETGVREGEAVEERRACVVKSG